MYMQTQTLTYSRAFMDALLGAMTVVPGAALLAAFKVRLLKVGVGVITPDTVIGDLTAYEADYSGYVAATPTLAGPVRLSNSDEGLIVSVPFIAGVASPFVPNTIAGYFLSVGAVFVAGELFAPAGPVPLGYPGSFLDLNLCVPGQLQQAAA